MYWDTGLCLFWLYFLPSPHFKQVLNPFSGGGKRHLSGGRWLSRAEKTEAMWSQRHLFFGANLDSRMPALLVLKGKKREEGVPPVVKGEKGRRGVLKAGKRWEFCRLWQEQCGPCTSRCPCPRKGDHSLGNGCVLASGNQTQAVWGTFHLLQIPVSPKHMAIERGLSLYPPESRTALISVRVVAWWYRKSRCSKHHACPLDFWMS